MKSSPIPQAKRLGSFTLTAGAIGLVWLASVLEAPARKPIRQAFFTFYPTAAGSKLDDLPSKTEHCGVCHYDFNGGGTRNPYGIEVGKNLGLGELGAIQAVRGGDWDGDGFSTDTEVTNRAAYVNTPTFPGLSQANVGQVRNIPVDQVQPYLVPSAGVDTTPPSVTVTFPNGGQTLVANRATNVTWTATDASGVASISIQLSIDNGATYQPVVLGLANTGTYSFVPANRPTNSAFLRVVAVDNAGNSGSDRSDNSFRIVSPPGGRVPSTLRDFDMPGTQPFEGGASIADPASCGSCHGNYNPATEPYFTWQGSMMAHAGRDKLFEANLVISNQDAPDSGDLCLRCHRYPGWVEGRSVPTDGSRMLASDMSGVSCDMCHRMVDPVYTAGASPTQDLAILAALSNPTTNFGNGMLVLDPNGLRRGPFTNVVSPHTFAVSPFHQKSAFCGTCHDVSNPVFQRDALGNVTANPMDRAATNFSASVMLGVERTYSEWLSSSYNSSNGVFAPAFAGNKPGGRVSSCQDCHMRDVLGAGCNPATNPGVSNRADLPLHDMTGGSTWLPGLLTNLYPAQVNAAAIQAGILRAQYMLSNSATLSVHQDEAKLEVTITNETGHKLPTGYPEGRRMWVNVQFFNQNTNLIGESAAYDPATGVLTRDAEAVIYEVKPGLETNLANALSLPPGPSFHFVLNNAVFKDNRIPPRGFSNAAFQAFGGAPVGHEYEDGQYWDEIEYTLPAGAVRADVRLYYQSISKEFVEFLRDQNVTDQQGQQMFNLWNNNGKCPPTLMEQITWTLAFRLTRTWFTPAGALRMDFLCQPGTTYTIEYADNLQAPITWKPFQNQGTFTATGTTGFFLDDFTSATSGGPAAAGRRFYRFSYTD